MAVRLAAKPEFPPCFLILIIDAAKTDPIHDCHTGMPNHQPARPSNAIAGNPFHK
jgi:hypothetical protein